MSVKDYLEIVFEQLVHEKNKLVYLLIMIVLSILALGLFVFKQNVNNIINTTFNEDIGFRSFTVAQKDNDSNKISDDISEIMKIDHVVDAFDNDELSTVLISSFKNDMIDGTITLLRGTPSTTPRIINGRNFNNDEIGVAICPNSFFPNFDPMKIDKRKIIDGNALLNTTFEVTYYDYIFDNFMKVQENNSYKKSFKIVGIYDNASGMNDSGTCYITPYDMAEISEKQNSIFKQGKISTIVVVVDNTKNVNYVGNKLVEMGFVDPQIRSYLDREMIKKINFSIAVIFTIILFIIVILTSNYVKKKININEQNMGILRSSGYTKKSVISIYLLELLIMNLFSLFSSIFYFLTNSVDILISTSLMLGGIIYNWLSILLTFVIVCLIPLIIMYKHIRKKLNESIIKCLRSEE